MSPHLLDPGLRAIAVQVDQSTGVGTLINVGDRVDMVVGFTGADKLPLVTVDPTTKTLTTVAGINTTTDKLVAPEHAGHRHPRAAGRPQRQPRASTRQHRRRRTTSLTGQQELVILAVTPQQAEVIKFAQIDGQITLVLRSPKDFVDANGNPVAPERDQDDGHHPARPSSTSTASCRPRSSRPRTCRPRPPEPRSTPQQPPTLTH